MGPSVRPGAMPRGLVHSRGAELVLDALEVIQPLDGVIKFAALVLGGLAEVSDNRLTVLADVATSLEDLDRAEFADRISAMEEKLAEKEGSELDHAIERLDHFKSIQIELNATAMH